MKKEFIIYALIIAEMDNLNIFRIIIMTIADVIITFTLLPKLREYNDIFDNIKIKILSFTEVLDHIINTGNKSFFYNFIYNLSERKLAILREYLDNILIKNLIRYLVSPAGAFIFFVLKKTKIYVYTSTTVR